MTAADWDRVRRDTPKDVFAAIALSFALRIAEDVPSVAAAEIAGEWARLHKQGIVRQAPRGHAVTMARRYGNVYIS